MMSRENIEYAIMLILDNQLSIDDAIDFLTEETAKYAKIGGAAGAALGALAGAHRARKKGKKAWKGALKGAAAGGLAGAGIGAGVGKFKAGRVVGKVKVEKPKPKPKVEKTKPKVKVEKTKPKVKAEKSDGTSVKGMWTKRGVLLVSPEYSKHKKPLPVTAPATGEEKLQMKKKMKRTVAKAAARQAKERNYGRTVLKKHHQNLKALAKATPGTAEHERLTDYTRGPLKQGDFPGISKKKMKKYQRLHKKLHPEIAKYKHLYNPYKPGK